MIRVSIQYPNQPGAWFDLDYYQNIHTPMISTLLGSACYDISLDRGISGLPGQPPKYSVVCHILSESMEIILTALGKHKPALDADVPNFTNQTASIQISEVIVAGGQGN